MRPLERREDSTDPPLPSHIIQETTGVEAGIILTIEMTVLVLSGRRRRKREAEVGVEEEVGAGASLVAEAVIVGHPPTEAKEKVGGKGEGSRVGQW